MLKAGLIVVVYECLTVQLRKLQNSFVVMLLYQFMIYFIPMFYFCLLKINETF